MTPASLPSGSVTATQPNPLADISTIASDINAPRAIKRQRGARMHDVTDEFEYGAELAARMKHAEIDG